ncbi:MAG TPA: thioesterase II family protein [Candidatus Angelobacter sp.]|nr:thioesterase II family protein [Candidatus Angelobacter sp.]
MPKSIHLLTAFLNKDDHVTANSIPAFSSHRLACNSVLRLFCFPYAGGNSSIYRDWSHEMPEGVEICPVQLPGRGNRLREPLMTHVTPMVESLGTALLPYLDRPFAFFGHSMGALIAFELSRLLRAKYGLGPVHLFISAWRSPDVIELKREYDLPQDQFVAMLRRLNGTPQEILDNPEAMEFLLPIVRADFQVCQTYVYHADKPLSCPITAFGGLNDSETTPKAISPWKNHTIDSFSMKILPGDHFFMTQSRAQLLACIAQQLVGAMRQLGNSTRNQTTAAEIVRPGQDASTQQSAGL